MSEVTYNLFLDDVRHPEMTYEYTRNPIYLNEKWEIVRSYNEFVKYIEDHGMPYMISFDHDLAEAHYSETMYQGSKAYMKYIEKTSEETGHDCVKWLVAHCMKNNLEFPIWHLHTMNPVGRENMYSYITSYLKSLTMESKQPCSCGGDCGCEK